MDYSTNIPIGYVIISIFIGYIYHYFKSNEYRDVFTIQTMLIGFVLGGIISVGAIIISLINTPLWNLEGLIASSIVLIYGIFLSIGFTAVGGVMAILIKKTLSIIISK